MKPISIALGSCLLICLYTDAASAADIQWNAVDLQGRKIPNALLDVISGGVILSTGAASPGNGPSLLSFDSTNLRNQDSPVTLRFRAVGREEASLFNILGNANQVVAVVLPDVYGESQKSAKGCYRRRGFPRLQRCFR